MKSKTKSRTLVALAGLSLMSLAGVTYLAGIVDGLCSAGFVLGAGLFADALRK